MIYFSKAGWYAQAISNLAPGAKFSAGDTYDSIEWQSPDISMPSREDVDVEYARLEKLYDDTTYQLYRATAYPSIGDQLDMLWHAIDAGTLDKSSDFYTAIKAIKDANPKPTPSE